MNKKLITTGMIMAMALSCSMTAFATSGWQRDENGFWYQNEDGTYPVSQWKWLDGNSDGIAECYYFDANGYMMESTETPDGYQVDQNGAWVEGGTVQTQVLYSSEAAFASGLSADEIVGGFDTGAFRSGSLVVEGNRVKILDLDGNAKADGWQWIPISEGENAETYCCIAVKDGYILTDTTTPDGYVVDGYGRLVVDGVVVKHDKNCDILPTGYFYNMDDVLVTDKNNCDLSRIDLKYVKTSMEKAMEKIVPFGDLSYMHVYDRLRGEYALGHTTCVR